MTNDPTERARLFYNGLSARLKAQARILPLAASDLPPDNRRCIAHAATIAEHLARAESLARCIANTLAGQRGGAKRKVATHE